MAEILQRIGKWVSEWSGWTIDTIDFHYINIVKYESLRRSSYIELPVELRHTRKGLINVKNNDDENFRWCHLALKFSSREVPQRVTKYRSHVDELDSNIRFPVKQDQYSKIRVQ